MKEDALLKIANDIKDQNLREKVISLIKEPRLSMLEAPDKSTGFKDSPASKRRHHSYEKGLIIHTVAMTKLALNLSDILEEIYGVRADRDVVIAASLLHDLFKYITYTEIYPGKYGRSKLGERLDHLSLITGELYTRKFPLDVIHAVVAHHGDGSPIEPRTIEALLVHMADRTDAEINDKAFFAAKDIIRECLAKEVLTLPKDVSPFQIILAKKEGGCDAVRRRFASLI
ncbi:MAG: HD domain-containing protein [Candidatus Verstraetearchaeota archaeon]|nr:HD domain-containing protein [Candidatus Verstraetearchaeota archaeon]